MTCVLKVETINDSYMVASGLPVKNGNKHAAEIATMALDLMAGSGVFIIPHRPSERLQLRSGQISRANGRFCTRAVNKDLHLVEMLNMC